MVVSGIVVSVFVDVDILFIEGDWKDSGVFDKEFVFVVIKFVVCSDIWVIFVRNLFNILKFK